MKIIECAQNTTEWFAARRGIPTASEFSRFLTPAKLQYSSTADTYINELLAEEFTTEVPRDLSGLSDIQRGNTLEDEAINAYAFETDREPNRVGFVLNDEGTAGCSPDAWQLEVKCPQGKKHIAWHRAGNVPTEHLMQVHGGMLICETDSWDFMSYHKDLPPFIVTVYRDETTKKIGSALDRFINEYAEARAKYMQISHMTMEAL